MPRGPDKKPRKKRVETGVRKTPVFDRTKQCEHCGEDFRQMFARHVFCDACAPNGAWCHRIRKYGVGKREYDVMFARQLGKCAICEKALVEFRDTHVDHDHTTGRVRGLLCNRCNTKVGVLEDESFVAKACAYMSECSPPLDRGTIEGT